MTTEDIPEFEALLHHLRRARGFDFTGYKRASLMRRVNRRMEDLGIKGYDAYLDHVEVHPDEFAALFDTILINVTGFFRDPSTWETLRDVALPQLIARKGPSDPIRVWSAGTASGEEAYSIAMLLAEALGIERFQATVKIYGTDVDDDALAIARAGVYSGDRLEAVPPDLRERYFHEVNGEFAFRSDVRRCVIFGRNDLVQDAPISRLDLLLCRNTLMYLNAETQSRILERFHFALTPTGILVLGRAETMLSRSELFDPVDFGARVFAAASRPATIRHASRRRAAAIGGRDQDGDASFSLRAATFDAAPVAQVVVDGDGIVSMANDRARMLFRLTESDIGRPVQDLEVSYRPVELRSLLEEARQRRLPVEAKAVEWRQAGSPPRHFDVSVVPLLDDDGGVHGTAVAFLDVTAQCALRDELERSTRELSTAYEELQSTNEELETTNEELQSTIEELETTNEELQSTNEELETMNEELQSTNAELETINDELVRRSDEFNEVNLFLESVLASLREAVIVVDNALDVRAWNSAAAELWGLRQDEVRGRGFTSLDIGLPISSTATPLRRCIAGETERDVVVVDARNRRGAPISCRVMCTPLVDAEGGRRGAIMLMEATPVDADRSPET